MKRPREHQAILIKLNKAFDDINKSITTGTRKKWNAPGQWDDDLYHLAFYFRGYNDNILDVFYDWKNKIYIVELEATGTWCKARRGKFEYTRKWKRRYKKHESIIRFLDNIAYCEM